MPRPVPLGLLLLACALSQAGCRGTADEFIRAQPRLAPPMAAARIDVEASEVTYNYVDFARQGDAARMRDGFARLLSHMLSGDSAAARPARFRVTERARFDATAMFFPCLIVLTMVGCPMGTYQTELDVELEVDGRRYAAKGSAWEFRAVGWGLESTAREKALAQALRSIAESGARAAAAGGAQ